MDFVSELERLRVEFHERALQRLDDMEGADHPDFFISNGEANAWRDAADEVSQVLVAAAMEDVKRAVETPPEFTLVDKLLNCLAVFLIGSIVYLVLHQAGMFRFLDKVFGF